jgi:predicted ribosome quality control (RQC) complex YloA/Tae2 family protein
MYCDALTVSALVDELRDKLIGGRVQRVLMADPLTVGLEFYAHPERRYLILSAQPEQGGRAHLVSYKLRRGVASASPLLLRLRKHARGAHLTAVEQPPAERILRLTLEGRQGTVVLIAELMGRLSNIIVIEEDTTILECVKHIPRRQNRYRVLLPGHPYVPPPPQQKLEWAALTAGRLNKGLQEQHDELLWKRLVGAVRGVSPLLAREVVFRATGDAQAPTTAVERVLAELQRLLQLPATGEWEPTVALQGSEVVAFAPYALTHYARYERHESISQAMEAFYMQQLGADPYAAARRKVQDRIDRQKERQEQKRQALLRAQPSEERLTMLRQKGELLLAHASQIQPSQETLIVPYQPGEAELHIALDPAKSAVENAQRYFRQYEKAKSAAQEVPRRLADVDRTLDYLEQLATDLALAEDQPGIAEVEAALAAAGFAPQERKRPAPRSTPLRIVSEDGFVILVGRNSWQNEELTFRLAQADDMWLHAQGVAGAHVVIRTEGRDVPRRTLLEAAELAAQHSAAREERSVRVDYTLRKNVRRPKGGQPGQVSYRGQKTLVVRPTE